MPKKIKNVKGSIHVTNQDNEEYFNQAHPTFRYGFCFINRTVYNIERQLNVWTGLIARRGKPALEVNSSNLEDWDIDSEVCDKTKECDMLPDHPAQPPEDEKRNTCPQCGREAEEDGSQFVCTSRFCQTRFIETGTGPELAPAKFKEGGVYLVSWFVSMARDSGYRAVKIEVAKRYPPFLNLRILDLDDNVMLQLARVEFFGEDSEHFPIPETLGAVGTVRPYRAEE